MREIWNERFRLRFLAFFSSISLFFVTVYSDDSSSTPRNGTKTGDHAPSSGKGSTIVIVFVLLVGVSVLSFFLFKFWQKKKREDQYARLLRLFEEDDELELELGLRD